LTLEDKKSLHNLVIKKSSLVFIAAFLLIIAGVLSIILWYSFYTAIDSDPEQIINMEDFKVIDPDITVGQVKGI